MARICPDCRRCVQVLYGGRCWGCHKAKVAVDRHNTPPCRHCHIRPATRPRQMCPTCYVIPAIRNQYVSLVKPEPPEPRMVARKPGDAPYRCYCCMRFRVHDMFALCLPCILKQEHALAGLPVAREELP